MIDHLEHSQLVTEKEIHKIQEKNEEVFTDFTKDIHGLTDKNEENKEFSEELAKDFERLRKKQKQLETMENNML